MLSILSVAALALASAAPPSNLVVSPCEIGEAYQFQTAHCDIALRNNGDQPISISDARAVRPDDRILPSAIVVPAKGTIYLKAEVTLSNSLGRTRRYFQFRTDEAGQPKRNAEVVGFVASVLDDARPVVDFGMFRAGEAPVKKSIELESREVDELKIVKVIAKPDYLDVQLGPDGRSLSAVVRPDAPWGLHHGDYIKLAINSPRQSEVWVSVKVDVHGEVVPDSNPYALGLMRQGSQNEFMIRLRSPSGKPFRTGALEVEKIKADADVVPCSPAAMGCKMLRLRLDDEQLTGEVGGIVTIDLPDYGRKLPVYVWGMLVGAKTEVKNLEDELKKSEAAMAAGANQSSVANASSSMDISKAISRTIGGVAAAPPPGSGPLLKWSVAHEGPVHGYVIYRADDEKGPFRRINEKTVLTHPDDEKASIYQWRDNSAAPGKSYWYYIGTMLRDGSKENLTAPQRVVAKKQDS